MKYIQIFSALLTPLIAIVTTYIAIQQYRNNRAKLRHELYERRLNIYTATSKFLMLSKISDKPTLDDWGQFHVTTTESIFLFDRDVSAYLKKIDGEGCRKAFLLHRIRESTLEDGHKMTLEVRDLERWFEAQEKLLAEKFLPYLNLKTLK